MLAGRLWRLPQRVTVVVTRRGWPAFGLVVALRAVAGAASGMASAGASHADASTCGSLSLGAGNPAGGGELTDASFVSAGQSWAVGDIGAAEHANRTLIERFNGSAWSVIPSPNQAPRITASTAFPLVLAEDGRSAAHSSLGRISRFALQWDGMQVVAGLARGFPRQRVPYRCGHPGGPKRVGGRLALRWDDSSGSNSPVPAPGCWARSGRSARAMCGWRAPAAQARSAARCSSCSSAGRHG
jgi:hypothetical protein